MGSETEIRDSAVLTVSGLHLFVVVVFSCEITKKIIPPHFLDSYLIVAFKIRFRNYIISFLNVYFL